VKKFISYYEVIFLCLLLTGSDG